MIINKILAEKGAEVISVSPDSTVAEVAALLDERRIGAVLVMEGGELVGILSERDIVRHLARRGVSVLEAPASELMTRALQTAFPDMTVTEAMTLMTACRIRHLPVLQDGAVAGMISIGDVVKARILQQEHEVDELRAYVGGTH